MSSVKRAPVPSHDVKTSNTGRRYVDIKDVIESELQRIKDKHDKASNQKPQSGDNFRNSTK
jgi:hypothetical protein